MKKRNKKLVKAMVLTAFMSIVGVYWCLSAVSLDSDSPTPIIVFVVTSFFMGWFALANMDRGKRNE